MESGRVVLQSDVEKYAKENDYIFMECSAKTGENIQQLFDEAVTKAARILNSRTSFSVS